MIEIVSYNKIKNKLRKHSHSVETNMLMNGYMLLTRYSLDKGEKSIENVKQQATERNLKKGKIVWYRTIDGWGCPFIYIFYKRRLLIKGE